MEQLDDVIVPKPGLVAVFQHKVRHAGRPVTAGRKYAMRTDVIYQAPDEIGRAALACGIAAWTAGAANKQLHADEVNRSAGLRPTSLLPSRVSCETLSRPSRLARN